MFRPVQLVVNQEVKPNLTNELAIQSLAYQDVRAKFGLSAQLAIHAIRRVAGNRKTAKKDNKPVKAFKPTSATYDIRTFSFREKDWTVSLTMVGGRERFVLAIGNYQRGLLKGQKPKSATLSKRKDGSYYLNIQLESTPPEPAKTDKVLGCDLGRTDICVTSEGEKFSGKQITKVRNLTYKAIKFGVKIVFVDPRYTSKMCHQCKHVHPVRGESYRNGKRFACGHCLWSGDADYNGAKNIAALGAVINQPCGSGLFCSLNRDDLGLLKTLTSAIAG